MRWKCSLVRVVLAMKRDLTAPERALLRIDYAGRLTFKVVWVGMGIIAAAIAATLGQSPSTDLWVGALVAVVLVLSVTTLHKILTIRTIGASPVVRQEFSRSTWITNLLFLPVMVGLVVAVKNGVTIPELVLILAGAVIYGEAVHRVAYLMGAKWMLEKRQAARSRQAAVEHYLQTQRRMPAK